MPAKDIDCACTRCKRVTRHRFDGQAGTLLRYECSVCGRSKLLTVAEARA
jgi:transposase-like protein